MKTTAIAPTLSLLAALVLALSLALACGGDDGDGTTGSTGDRDTLSGYFTDLKLIFDDAEDETNEAEEFLDNVSSDTGLAAQFGAVDTYLARIDTAFNDAISRLEGLSVPPIAADGHQAFIDGVRDSVSAGNALRSDLQDLSNREQLDDRLARFDSDIDAAVDKADAACLALQKIADTEEISIDLDC